MCLSPITVLTNKNTGVTSQVACRHCRICRDNRVNDLVGRCIAEQSTAHYSFAVTLTYSGEGPETALLRYRDVQLMLKRLRKNHQVRYIVAGEYGSRKGRAHWHAVLFFHGTPPKFDIGDRIDWDYWPNGFAYFKPADYAGIRYCLKYALKDQQDRGADKSLSMSLKPPLGHAYFMELADELVSQRLALHSPEYSFAGILDRHGKPRKFWLQGRMRELFIERYVAGWRSAYHCDPPLTEWFGENLIYPDTWRERRTQRIRDYVATMRAEDDFDPRFFEEPREVAVATLPGGSILRAFHDGYAELIYRGQTWLLGGPSADVAAQLQLSRLPPHIVEPASLWLKANLPDAPQMPKSLARSYQRDANRSHRRL